MQTVRAAPKPPANMNDDVQRPRMSASTTISDEWQLFKILVDLYLCKRQSTRAHVLPWPERRTSLRTPHRPRPPRPERLLTFSTMRLVRSTFSCLPRVGSRRTCCSRAGLPGTRLCASSLMRSPFPSCTCVFLSSLPHLQTCSKVCNKAEEAQALRRRVPDQL